MEKEFVEYELALRMKAIGFDEPCLACYIDEEDKDILSFSFDSNDCYQEIGDNELKRNTQFKNSITAPTYSAAFRWFREKHGLFGIILPYLIIGNQWYYKITNRNNSSGLPFEEGFETYEEAELACLEKLIEIVKEK